MTKIGVVGAWVIAAAAAAGLASALYRYLHLGSGVDHTPGALLVTASSALLAVAAVVLALAAGAAGWIRALLIVLVLLDVLGTGAAAWFLEGWFLLAMMLAALVAWVVVVGGQGGAPARPAHARGDAR
jgi:hypothetical protein